MKIDADKIKDYIFGPKEVVEEPTETGYRSYTKKTGPNILERIIDNLRQKFDPGYISGVTARGYQQPTPTPSPFPTATPTPQQQYAPQQQDQYATPTPTPEAFKFVFKPHETEETRKIWSPPDDDLELYQRYFPKEATSAATVAFNESMYNPKAVNKNTKGKLKGTEDVGYFQINYGKPDDSGQMSTFDDLWRRYPLRMKQIGAYTKQDLFDKEKNFQVAKLLKDDAEKEYKRLGLDKNPWDRWYGWKDQGFVNVGEPIDYSQYVK